MTPVLQFHDREVVLVADLAPVIQKWMDRKQEAHQREWGKQLQTDKRRNWKSAELSNYSVRGYGPVALLTFESGLAERRIWGILNYDQASVGLDVADRLMMAMDLHVSDLPIYDYHEVKQAVATQTELIRQVVRCAGGFIPEGKAARLELPRHRRLLTKAA